MNRILKFRVWDITFKRFWKTQNGLSFYLMDLDIPVSKFISRGDEYIVQQFTGLCDKNGREIYEGDVIQYTPFNQLDCKNTIAIVHDLDKYHWFAELEEMLQMKNKCDIVVVGHKFDIKT